MMSAISCVLRLSYSCLLTSVNIPLSLTKYLLFSVFPPSALPPNFDELTPKIMKLIKAMIIMELQIAEIVFDDIFLKC